VDITLVKWTDQPINTVYAAAKLCTNQLDYWENMIESVDVHDKIKRKLIQLVVDSGHHSVLEHINLTFSIAGISRASGRQLLRSRIASFTEKSQRYVNMNNASFIKPVSIFNNIEADLMFDSVISHIKHTYNRMLEIGVPKEDARSLLPNATATDLVETINFRELMHICNTRLCTTAQAEIRGVVQLMKEAVKECLGEFWSDMLVPKCVSIGRCNEKDGCGYLKQ